MLDVSLHEKKVQGNLQEITGYNLQVTRTKHESTKISTSKVTRRYLKSTLKLPWEYKKHIGKVTGKYQEITGKY